MMRREFITLIGGVAAAWPLTARARMRVQIVAECDPKTQRTAAVLVRGGLRPSLWQCGPHLRSKLDRSKT